MPTLTQTQAARRSAQSRTKLRRCELVAGSCPPGVPLALRQFLARYDPDLELHWHAFRRHWVLYRRIRRGITPASDILLKEFDIRRGGGYLPLGDWLADWLRKNDKTRGGSIDPSRADRAYQVRLKLEEKGEAEAEEKRSMELGERLALEIEKYAGRRPRSQEIRAAHIK